MMITQYEYPAPERFKVALEETVSGFLVDAHACVRWIDEIPRSPYPSEMVERITGSPDGFKELPRQIYCHAHPRLAGTSSVRVEAGGSTNFACSARPSPSTGGL